MIETQDLPPAAVAVNGAVDAPAILQETRRLTAAALLAAAAVREHPVTIPGLGEVVIRELSKAESNAIGQQVKRGLPDGTTEGDEDLAQRLILTACLVDPPLTRAEVDLLWTGRVQVVQALMQEIYRLNELGAYAVTADTFRGQS